MPHLGQTPGFALKVMCALKVVKLPQKSFFYFGGAGTLFRLAGLSTFYRMNSFTNNIKMYRSIVSKIACAINFIGDNTSLSTANHCISRVPAPALL